MKSSNTINILGLSVILGLSFLGCSDKSTESADSTQSTTEYSSVDLSIPKTPEGEPTNLVGLDGNRIYTSEINTNITDPEIIERLSDYTFYAEPIKPNAVMDTFMFFKPSTGIVYNIRDNPELYNKNEDDIRDFIGEVPENTNEWQRVNVGDKICGLTLKTAEMGLVKGDDGDFIPTGLYYCEFEGELTLTGYLYVNSPSEWYGMPGGEMTLYFFDGSVPLAAGSAVRNYSFERPTFSDSIIFNHIELLGTSEIPSLSLDETIDETAVDMSGISRGDVVKVKATLSNFGCSVRNITGQQTFINYWGHLADIEILSDVIENG